MPLGAPSPTFAECRTHCALKQLLPSRGVPAGRCTGLPACGRELWGGPGLQQPPWPPQTSLEELCGQRVKSEALCALPFFPGIDSWAVEEESSEGKSCALFHKGNN